MKTRTILLIAVSGMFLASCSCDCDKYDEKNAAMRNGSESMQTGTGDTGDLSETENTRSSADRSSDRSSGNGGNDRSAGTSSRNGSSGYMDKNVSGSERTIVPGGGGVGNANTERGVNTFDNDGAPAGTTTPQPARKP